MGIWCLDLKHNDKWYKSEQQIPEKKITGRSMHTFKDKQNCVHLISFIVGFHFKARLYDLLPSEILECIKKRKRKKKCAECNVKNIKLMICSGCKHILYCSRKCQKRSWNKQHRHFC